MFEPLPITIVANDALKTRYQHLASHCNKLEAQLNFQTMTAGWYGDEDKIYQIRLLIETVDDLANYLHQFQQDQNNANKQNLHQLADDVLCFDNQQQLHMDVVIALTDSEHALLTSNEKLVLPLMQKKLTKVMNLVAPIQGHHPIV
ncbi:hypothetical protein [Thalassotalea ganghwensis]